jgi:hypothetical protein
LLSAAARLADRKARLDAEAAKLDLKALPVGPSTLVDRAFFAPLSAQDRDERW